MPIIIIIIITNIIYNYFILLNHLLIGTIKRTIFKKLRAETILKI